MVINTRIKAVVPKISDASLEEAVKFAMDAMRRTRDVYHEPVSLLEVAVTSEQKLRFTIRALFTHNTSDFHLNYTCEDVD